MVCLIKFYCKFARWEPSRSLHTCCINLSHSSSFPARRNRSSSLPKASYWSKNLNVFSKIWKAHSKEKNFNENRFSLTHQIIDTRREIPAKMSFQPPEELGVRICSHISRKVFKGDGGNLNLVPCFTNGFAPLIYNPTNLKKIIFIGIFYNDRRSPALLPGFRSNSCWKLNIADS